MVILPRVSCAHVTSQARWLFKFLTTNFTAKGDSWSCHIPVCTYIWAPKWEHCV